MEVIGPDGRRLLSLTEARNAQTLRLDRAGFYQVRLVNGRDMVMGVNPDRRESDLQPVADDVQRLWSGSAGTGASQTETASTTDEKYRPVSFLVVCHAACILNGDRGDSVCEPIHGHAAGGI